MSTPRRYRKPDVLTRLPTGTHAIVEASAGTGKTYTLEHLLLDLLLVARAPIDSILVVTFTDKATADLITKVRARIVELLDGDWTDAGAEVPDEGCWILDETRTALLRQALFAFDTARISTIHSFCQSILGDHAFGHRRLFVEEQVEEKAIFAAAFREVLRSKLAHEVELLPYLEAWLDTGAELGALEALLLACWKARGELRPRFDPAGLAAALAGFPDEQAIGAASFERSIRGLRSPATAVRKLLQLRELIARYGADLPRFLVELDSLEKAGKGPLRYLRKEFSDLAPSPAAAAIHAAFVALDHHALSFGSAVAQLFLPHIRSRIEARKLEAGQFDYQDMLSLVARSLEGPRGPELIRVLRSRYRYALVDEFQDTDDIQWSIFRRIFHDAGDESTVVAIGDPKQAIYSFRGADIQTYFRAQHEIKSAGGGSSSLPSNYRSTPPLVRAYNLILEKKPHFFTPPIRYVDPVVSAREDLSAVDGDGRALAPICLLSPHSATGKLLASDMRRALGRRIAVEISDILDPRSPSLRFGVRGRERAIDAGEIFILTRTTREGYQVGEYLRERGVPFAFYKQDGLFQRPEAQYVLDLLEAIAEPRERSRRARAWITPFFGLSLRELRGLDELPATHPLMASLLRWSRTAASRDPERLFSQILDESGVVRRLLFFGDRERELTNYLHLFEILLEEAQRAHAGVAELASSLRAFIDGSRLPEGESGGVQRLESERKAVQIMTIHKSKGLEATVVFVFGGTTAPPPDGVRRYHDGATRVLEVHPTSSDVVDERVSDEIEAENQRLLYVAMTRARARLYLPYYPARNGGKESLAMFNGCYRQLNDRLRQLVDGPSANFDELFKTIRLEAGALDEAPRENGSPVSPFVIPPELLEEHDPTALYDATRREHAGFIVTSYTGLKQAQGGYHAPAPEAEDLAAPATATDDADEGDAAGEGVSLRGGKEMGSFLHAVLEELPLESVAATPDAREWAARDDVRPVFRRHLGRHGVDARDLPGAERIVHTALVAPLRVRGDRRIPGLASVRQRREMEFLYPIPETRHPQLTDALAGAGGERFRVERGFIKGFVDVIFEHEGLVYFVDWKSDRLPRWDAATVDAHVQSNYRLQAVLYSLALVKVLGIHDEESYRARFGGYLYCFLRGMRSVGDGRDGVHYACPDWASIERWEAELRRPDMALGAVGADS